MTAFAGMTEACQPILLNGWTPEWAAALEARLAEVEECRYLALFLPEQGKIWQKQPDQPSRAGLDVALARMHHLVPMLTWSKSSGSKDGKQRLLRSRMSFCRVALLLRFQQLRRSEHQAALEASEGVRRILTASDAVKLGSWLIAGSKTFDKLMLIARIVASDGYRGRDDRFTSLLSLAWHERPHHE